MYERIFIIELDAVITRKVIIEELARKFRLYDKYRQIKDKYDSGEAPYNVVSSEYYRMFREIPLTEIRQLIENIELNKSLVKFIEENKQCCFISSVYLDNWIDLLIKKIDIEFNHVVCAHIEDNFGITDNICKLIEDNKYQRQNIVSVGVDNTDAELIEISEIGIAYGGVKEIAPSVMVCASHAVYEEERLTELLYRLV